MPVQVRPAVPEAASGDNRPFWAIFLCKENSPQKGASRGFIAFQASCFLRAYHSPFFPFSPAFSRNARLAQNPPSAPMSAVGVTSMANMNEISIPTTAPARVGMAMIIAIATTTMTRGPIFFMTLPFEKCSCTHDQGLLSPFDKSRKLVSII